MGPHMSTQNVQIRFAFIAVNRSVMLPTNFNN
jgi:hypothetical protein